MLTTAGCAADYPVNEMAIVDTFTRLIFGQEGDYGARELAIIQALRLVYPHLLVDSNADMGAYLRALEVREMIHLVARVREQLSRGPGAAPAQLRGNRPRDAGRPVTR